MHVLLVDDHALFRDGVALILKVIDGQLLVSHANSCEQALQRLDLGPQPDLILLDLGLPGVGGLEALRQLRERCEGAAIVVLSGTDDMQLARNCIDAGAMGFVHKASDSRVMIDTLRQVLAGQPVLPAAADATAGGVGSESFAVQLTPRQREVLLRLIKGMSNRAIALDLGILDSTVKSHVGSVLAALGASNRTEAVYAARRLGLHFS
jgi:two-component system, NarL family, nitrate/nitrite response regulator NarL